MSELKLTQAQLVPVLKTYIDYAMDGHPSDQAIANRTILGMMARQNIGTKFVMHNIGKRRREWLQTFLSQPPS